MEKLGTDTGVGHEQIFFCMSLSQVQFLPYSIVFTMDVPGCDGVELALGEGKSSSNDTVKVKV